jgi:hypothetical protein
LKLCFLNTQLENVFGVLSTEKKKGIQ